MHRESEPESNTSINYLKALSVILMFILTFFFGMLPYKWLFLCKSFYSFFIFN